MTIPNTVTRGDGTAVNVGAVIIADQAYTLASALASIADGGASDPITGVASGSYIWALTAGTWAGATIKLQALGPDGATWLDVSGSSLAANGTVGVVVGANASLRLAATGGAPLNVNSSLS